MSKMFNKQQLKTNITNLYTSVAHTVGNRL